MPEGVQKTAFSLVHTYGADIDHSNIIIITRYIHDQYSNALVNRNGQWQCFRSFFRINIYAFWHSFLIFNCLQKADKSIRHDDKTVASDMQVKIVVEYLYTSTSAAKQKSELTTDRPQKIVNSQIRI